MKMTGAQILLETLKREGVDTIFGYPGGAVIDIYDEIPRHADLRHILVRHEQAAVHAADGYARASGKVGTCLVTSGPGATNAVTGIATAYCDSIPMVIITGQVPTPLIGNDAFQEVDIVGITRPCTKHNYLVKDIKQLTHVLRQAFYLARSGRPGPVLVDLPKDIVQASTEFIWPETTHMRSYNPTYRPNLNQLRKSVDILSEAKAPLLLIGGGVINSEAAKAVADVAQTMQIPVTSTLMGLGGFPANDPLWLGMVGMHGGYAANMAINNCDVIMAVGARFDDRVTGRLSAFAPNARIIHIDIDPTSIRKNVSVDVPVVGDCRLALEGMLEIVQSRQGEKDWAAVHKPWIAQLQTWASQRPLTYVKGDSIKPQEVIETLYDLCKDKNTIIATEVGQHQMWTAQYYSFNKPRTLLTSGGLGTMGYGFPSAIGAQFAMPEALVVTVAGDGSLQMNIQEMATAVANKLPIKILILNNQYLGMVRQWQDLFYQKNYSNTNMEAQPDFVKLAEAYGAEGYRVTEASELEATLAIALASPNTAIIDVVVEREENVSPIVPAGAALDEMLLI